MCLLYIYITIICAYYIYFIFSFILKKADEVVKRNLKRHFFEKQISQVVKKRNLKRFLIIITFFKLQIMSVFYDYYKGDTFQILLFNFTSQITLSKIYFSDYLFKKSLLRYNMNNNLWCLHAPTQLNSFTFMHVRPIINK